MLHTPPKLDGREFDVAVIGAGINGAAAARQLAQAGYTVFLCDKGDFAAGASSRSSRMLHCGLRYFEAENPLRTFALHPRRLTQALAMARAGMDARREIALTAGEGVKPFTMCFPVYPESPVRGWHIGIGLRLLAALGPGDPPIERRKITREFASHLPFAGDLRDLDRLQSVTTYREYVFDWPERFCVDAALEAEAAGAVVRNFCTARLRERGVDGRWTIDLEAPDGEAGVKARLVLNMAGCDVDVVNGSASSSTTPRKLVRGTKGAHIMVRLPQAYQGYGIATMHRQGMPFYCLPSHEDYFYFGPTETLYEGDTSTVAADDDDLDFLLAEANHLLPGLGLKRSDIAFTWAGVRPLTWDKDQPWGRRSREIHDLAADGMPGVLAMTAGPVMSHRSAARSLHARAEAMIGKPAKPRKQDSAWQISRDSIRLSNVGDSQKARRAAARRAVMQEHARDLKGILYTRNATAWRGHLSREKVEEAAHAVADLLGWSDEDIGARVNDFITYQRTVFRDGGGVGHPAPIPTPTRGIQP